MEESREFEASRANRAADAAAVTKRRSPIFDVIAERWGVILMAGGAFIASNACFYVIITWVISYGTATLLLPKSMMLGGIMIGSFFMIPALIFVAHLSDSRGRFGIFRLGCIVTGIFAFAFFPLLETGTLAGVAAATSIALSLIALMYGPQAALFAELFDTEVRYSGATLGYQVGVLLGGGFTPMIATALFEYFSSSFAIACFMAVCCLISAICVTILHARRPDANRGSMAISS